MQKRLIDIKEASEYLDLTVNTLYSWVSQRKIPFVKVGRLTKFDLKDIDRFIEHNKIEPFRFHALQAGFIRLRPEDTKTNEGRSIPLNSILTRMLNELTQKRKENKIMTRN